MFIKFMNDSVLSLLCCVRVSVTSFVSNSSVVFSTVFRSFDFVYFLCEISVLRGSHVKLYIYISLFQNMQMQYSTPFCILLRLRCHLPFFLEVFFFILSTSYRSVLERRQIVWSQKRSTFSSVTQSFAFKRRPRGRFKSVKKKKSYVYSISHPYLL